MASGQFNSNSYESGTVPSTYGTIKYAKSGHICMVFVHCSGMATSGWATLCSGLPKPLINENNIFSAVAGNGTTNVSLNIKGSGELSFTGRGSIGTVMSAITYVCQ